MTRAKGDGSIYRREDGLYVGRIELPRKDGKRRRKTIYNKSKTALLADMRKLRRQLDLTGDLATDSMTVERYVSYWLREIGERTRRPGTMRSYRSVAKVHVIPVIGPVRLSKLSPEHVRKVSTTMLDAGLSSSTAHQVHAFMSAVFKDAWREGRISSNPCTIVQAPTPAVAHLDALTTDQARDLLASIDANPDVFLWAVFLLTGARRGEILGLTWDRVQDGILDLSKQLVRIKPGQGVPGWYDAEQIKGGLYLAPIKSKDGSRIVPLVPPLSTMLERWRAVAPSNAWGLVFSRVMEDGTVIPLDPGFVTRRWREYADERGFRGVRLHDLRHTTVDLLLEAGVPEDVVMEIVGHSTVLMTRRYKSRQKLARRVAAMQALSQHLALS